jgi:diacylglycerol kinase family enzyme
MRNITNVVQENENKEKKESTYKKLIVFKEFEKQEAELDIDEEEFFVRAFKQLVNNAPDIYNCLEPKNKERINRLNDKYSSK